MTSDELSCLESLLPYASEGEAERIHQLLTGTLPAAAQKRTATPAEWKALIAANLAKYCPHEPWPKQKFLLDLDCPEIMFGGSKGPGKTDLLLMAALRYVHVPGYACLLLRRNTKQAKQANALMDRLQRWVPNGAHEAKWNLSDSSLRFESGALLKFGYIDSPIDAYQFMGSEYQTIIYDELTDFRIADGEENLYRFMRGMNRAPETGAHPWLNQVPWQILSGTNPGGLCHAWVKQRFITPEAVAWTKERVDQRAVDKAAGRATAEPEPRAFYSDDGDGRRAYVPALIYDNPAVNAEKYIESSLRHLPVVKRARYVNGDWSVQEYGLIDSEHFRYWHNRGQILQALRRDESVIDEIDERELVRFATVDTAGTSKQKAAEAKGKPASWSVGAVWDYWPKTGFLFLRHIWRDRVGYVELYRAVVALAREWKPRVTLVERAHVGPMLAEFARLEGDLNIETMPTVTGDMKGESGSPGKVERATPLFRKLASGEIFFPRYNATWLPIYEAELLAWTGMEEETADQIDVSSYACNHVETMGGVAGGTSAGVYFGGVGRVDSMPRVPAGVGGWR